MSFRYIIGFAALIAMSCLGSAFAGGMHEYVPSCPAGPMYTMCPCQGYCDEVICRRGSGNCGNQHQCGGCHHQCGGCHRQCNKNCCPKCGCEYFKCEECGCRRCGCECQYCGTSHCPNCECCRPSPCLRKVYRNWNKKHCYYWEGYRELRKGGARH